MLTDKQQSNFRLALEEFIYETTGDPMRVEPHHVENLHVLLAGRGLAIGPLVSQQAHDYLPASAIRTATPAQAIAPAPVSAPAAPQALAVPGLLTPTERGILVNAEAAAKDRQHAAGYSFKSPIILSLTAIIRRISGERK